LHNFEQLSKIFSDTAWRGIYANAELFVVIEFHTADDGSNLSGISPSKALKWECSWVVASYMMLNATC